MPEQELIKLEAIVDECSSASDAAKLQKIKTALAECRRLYKCYYNNAFRAKQTGVKQKWLKKKCNIWGASTILDY